MLGTAALDAHHAYRRREATKEGLAAWFKAGVAAVGIGSQT